MDLFSMVMVLVVVEFVYIPFPDKDPITDQETAQQSNTSGQAYRSDQPDQATTSNNSSQAHEFQTDKLDKKGILSNFN